MIEEKAREYYCIDCRRKVLIPRFDESDSKVIIGYCPQCGHEILRRMKTVDKITPWHRMTE